MIVTAQDIILVMKGLTNLKHLMINTCQIFSDDSFFAAIQEYSPNLCKLSILIPREYRKFGTKENEDLRHLEILVRKFPDQINDLVLAYDCPQYIHRPLTMKDYERMGTKKNSCSRVEPVGTLRRDVILNDPGLYPKSMKRLDVSRCIFKNNAFALPHSLTHLTVSYPALPQNYENIKLPSTLEYLNISGFVYHSAYESESTHQYLCYGERWLQMLPSNAPSLHTLILHLYVHNPKDLFSHIRSHYAQSIEFLDICICHSQVLEVGNCNCEGRNLLGQCCRRNMIQSLPNLTELLIHNEVGDKDFEKLPDSLKVLHLYTQYEEYVSAHVLESIERRGIQLRTIPQGLFDCSESSTEFSTDCICPCFLRGRSWLI